MLQRQLCEKHCNTKGNTCLPFEVILTAWSLKYNLWPGTTISTSARTVEDYSLLLYLPPLPRNLVLTKDLGSYPFLLTGVTCGPGGPAGQLTVNRRWGDIHTPYSSALSKALVGCICVKEIWLLPSKNHHKRRVAYPKRNTFIPSHPSITHLRNVDQTTSAR